MAALSRCFELNLKEKHVIRIIEPVFTGILGVRYFQKTESLDPELIDNGSVEYIEDDLKVDEKDVQRKRNKSRLLPQHRNILHDRIPYSESKAWYHETVKYKQKLYGMYGEASGVNPGIMWPTREQLTECLEYEALAHPNTPQEMIEKSAQARAEEERLAKERQEDISKKLSKLEQWKQELNAKLFKKEADAIAAKAKKDRLVEEVRRHFGFKVDPRDDRFKEMLEKKEKEEKKLVKEAKRKAKEAKVLAKLTELGSKAITPTPLPPAQE